MPGFDYLCAPYHHHNKAVMEYRQMKATQVAANLLRSGVTIFSTLSHTQNMIGLPDPCDWEFWEQHNSVFLEQADRLLVLCLPGWKASKGVRAEIEIAELLGLPILYLDQNGVPCKFAWEDACELGVVTDDKIHQIQS